MPAIPLDAEKGWSPILWRLAEIEGGNVLNVTPQSESEAHLSMVGKLFLLVAAAIDAFNFNRFRFISSPSPQSEKGYFDTMILCFE